MSDGEDRRERQPRPERLTIRDIARLADVSVATAYRVAKGKPDVAAETRARVTSVMQEYAFIPQRDEDDPASGWTGLVGFSLPYVDESYFAAILSGAAEALYQLNQRVVLCPTYHQYYREVTLLDRLLGGTTDGALILLPEQSNAELSRCRSWATRSSSSTRASRSATASRPSRRRTPPERARRRTTCSGSVTAGSG